MTRFGIIQNIPGAEGRVFRRQTPIVPARKRLRLPHPNRKTMGIRNLVVNNASLHPVVNALALALVDSC